MGLILGLAGFIGARTTEAHYRIDGANAVEAGTWQYTKGEFLRVCHLFDYYR